MAGASEETLRVDYVNANWTPGDAGGAGAMELLVVTEDGARRALPVDPAEAAAVLSLVDRSGVLLLDPRTSTLIAANLAGEWFQDDWCRGERRVTGPPHRRRTRVLE